MTESRMSLTAALGRGWERMVDMLFRPFELGKWLVVGFAAWLAGLAGGGGFSYGGASGSSEDGGGSGGAEDVAAAFREGWQWLLAHELVAGLIVAAIVAGLALVLLALWLSSRGKFIFLDNVVHDRAEIAQPWRRYRKAGNSLFAFRLVVALVCIVVAGGAIALGVWLAVGSDGWAEIDGAPAVLGVAAAVVLGCLTLLLVLVAFFLLDAYVVPLMHRYDLGVMAGWRRFFALARGRWGWFLLSFLFVCVLAMLACAAVFVTGLMTCCLGFLLLIIPYVGTVLLLPLFVTYRAFTLEFLAQADPDLLGHEVVEEGL